MKYTVAWVEIHQETVDATNEEDALKQVTHIARPSNGSYYTVVDKLTRIEMHNPASDLLKEMEHGN